MHKILVCKSTYVFSKQTNEIESNFGLHMILKKPNPTQVRNRTAQTQPND